MSRRSTRPLDSTTSSPRKENSREYGTLPSAAACAGAVTAPIATRATDAATAPRQPVTQELREPRVHAPGPGEVVELVAQLRAARRAGADGPQQRVAWGVPAVHEVDHLDAVAEQPQHGGPQRVGESVGEPLPQDAGAGEQRGRGRGRPGAERGAHRGGAGRGG